MRKHIKLSDVIHTQDSIKGKTSNKSTGLNTQIIVRAHNTKYNGSEVVKVLKNKTSLPGRTMILETIFPITPNIQTQHIFINDNIRGEYDISNGQEIVNPIKPDWYKNINSNILPRNNPELFAKRKVEYWCAGDGAINRTILNQSFESHSTDTKLYNMIPFRLIKASDTLQPAERSLYKMEVLIQLEGKELMKGYFFKKIDFENTDGINMTVDGLPYTPKWSDTMPDLDSKGYGFNTAFAGNKVQSNFINMGMNVNALEFKEWFDYIGSGRQNATISEIGLISGLDCVKANPGDTKLVPIKEYTGSDASNVAANSEVYDAELFAHLTFDPYSVSRENATIDFEYRVYS